jgi:hypothetical protein
MISLLPSLDPVPSLTLLDLLTCLTLSQAFRSSGLLPRLNLRFVRAYRLAARASRGWLQQKMAARLAP